MAIKDKKTSLNMGMDLTSAPATAEERLADRETWVQACGSAPLPAAPHHGVIEPGVLPIAVFSTDVSAMPSCSAR
ncbi:hypothetical protein [Streptomyces sp. BF23-19]|uniref:hypothetical protein n=1 Tax=unclassified Streptomyces TaxID=2593676 RepID=UPI0034E4C372